MNAGLPIVSTTSRSLTKWLVQSGCLLKKNALISMRRPIQLIAQFLVPSLIVLILTINTSIFEDQNQQSFIQRHEPIKLDTFADCKSVKTDHCARICFSPVDDSSDFIMRKTAHNLGLKFGSEVRGFPSDEDLKSYVAHNLGSVHFSIFFRNESLWTRSSEIVGPDAPQNISYVIFYNSSSSYSDDSKSLMQANIPLLTLQTQLEKSSLQFLSGLDKITYNVDYGEIWSFQPGDTDQNVPLPPVDVPLLNISGTSCPTPIRNFDELAQFAPWVFALGLQVMGVITFQMLVEERGKSLVTSLRRLGMLESAYWFSWFVATQIVLLLSLAVAVCTTLYLRYQHSYYILQHIDISLLMWLIWLGATASMCNFFFLSSITTGPSMSTFLVFLNFVVCIFVIALSSGTPLNNFTTVTNTDELGLSATLCVRVSSSYNAVDSPSLSGNALIRFIVFFMPSFHIARALTDILSVLQYGDGPWTDISADMYRQTVQLAYNTDGSDIFESQWLSSPLGLLAASSVVYLCLSWFCAQVVPDASSEGRNVLTVLIPWFMKPYLFGDEDDGNTSVFDRSTTAESTVGGRHLYGDVRGLERQMSREQKSIRAFKVSKTYSGVQALKEVTFSMTRGQVFVLLGHNGAGKSTLINILSGTCKPTHGKVYISGLDVCNDITAIQQIIGVCPQDDQLWDDLTAREHMAIHGIFKGLHRGPSLDSAIDAALSRVRLLERANTLAKDFSGGMKRRLSLAMSIVGQVEVLFLDGKLLASLDVRVSQNTSASHCCVGLCDICM